MKCGQNMTSCSNDDFVPLWRILISLRVRKPTKYIFGMFYEFSKAFDIVNDDYSLEKSWPVVELGAQIQTGYGVVCLQQIIS